MALRAALTGLGGVGHLPQCWQDVSRARSVTGRHRRFPLPMCPLGVLMPQVPRPGARRPTCS